MKLMRENFPWWILTGHASIEISLKGTSPTSQGSGVVGQMSTCWIRKFRSRNIFIMAWSCSIFIWKYPKNAQLNVRWWNQIKNRLTWKHSWPDLSFLSRGRAVHVGNLLEIGKRVLYVWSKKIQISDFDVLKWKEKTLENFTRT